MFASNCLQAAVFLASEAAAENGEKRRKAGKESERKVAAEEGVILIEIGTAHSVQFFAIKAAIHELSVMPLCVLHFYPQSLSQPYFLTNEFYFQRDLENSS